MATIVLPGKKQVTVQDRVTLGDLKLQGLVPAACQLVRKDPRTGAVRQLADAEVVTGDDLVFAVPRHVQGAAGSEGVSAWVPAIPEAVSRRALLGGLAATALDLAACDVALRPDSRRHAWAVLVDLSGTAVSDRAYYVQELERFVGALAELKPNVLVHVVGFSAFPRPLTSGQAHLVLDQIGEVVEAVRRWPLDARTDLGAAFAMAHELLTKAAVDRRLVWMLSDGIHDPDSRWRGRPAAAVALPRTPSLATLAAEGGAVHWDALDEHQLAGWQRAFDEAGLPAVLHLRGFVEASRARLQRLPRRRDEVASR